MRSFNISASKPGFEAFWDEQLQVWDSIRLTRESNVRVKGILGDFTHIGTLWVLSEQIREEHLQHIQNTILPGIEQHDSYGGASLLQEKGDCDPFVGPYLTRFTKNHENVLGLLSPRTISLTAT